MNAIGYVILALVVVGIAAWVRSVRQENANCCKVTPSAFPVKKEAATPAPKKVKKAKKTVK